MQSAGRRGAVPYGWIGGKDEKEDIFARGFRKGI